MSEAQTKGPWEFSDVPGAGLQIRGPYKGSTRLLFSDIWRQFPELEWDATMVANARLAAAAPDLLDGAKEFAAYESTMADGDEISAMIHYANASRMLAAAITKATKPVSAGG